MDTQQKIFETQNRLASKIKEMRSRIETHREYIGGDETRTRQLLIDPLLRELGWDLEDPSQVHLEFKTESGRPDYALLSNGGVVAVIEAKRLGKNLGSQPHQVIKYGTDPNIPHLRIFVKTDGERWVIVPLKPVTEEQKILSISKEDPFVGAQTIMRLLQSTLSDGTENTSTGEPESSDSDWVSIATLTGTSAKERPVRVKIGTDVGIDLSRPGWKNATIELTRSLVEKGRLTPEMCPVFVIGSQQPVVTMGKQHARSVEIAGDLWVNTNKTSQALIQLIRSVLKACELSEESVYVSYSPK